MTDFSLHRLISESRGLDEPTDLESRHAWVRSVVASAPTDEYTRIETRCAAALKRIASLTLNNEKWRDRIFRSLGIHEHSVFQGEINFYGDLERISPDSVCKRFIRAMGMTPYDEDGFVWGNLPLSKTVFPEFKLPRGNTVDLDAGVSSPKISLGYVEYRMSRQLRPLRKDDPVSVVWKEWTVGPRFYAKCHIDQGAGKLIISSADCCLISQTGKSFDKP